MVGLEVRSTAGGTAAAARGGSWTLALRVVSYDNEIKCISRQ